MTTHRVGLGPANFQLAIYIANRPVNSPYPVLNDLQPLAVGELQDIVANNSNHWRKVFNVYAKFIWQYTEEKGRKHSQAKSWQAYRDNDLLQSHSIEALLFSPPDCSQPHTKIIAGKTYAASLNLPPLTWVDAYFAINREYRIIVSPYLDYRQLSNDRIDTLVGLVKQLK